jgi:hypothetical protein
MFKGGIIMVVQSNLKEKAEEVVSLLEQKTGEIWEVEEVLKVNRKYLGVKKPSVSGGVTIRRSYPILSNMSPEELVDSILRTEEEDETPFDLLEDEEIREIQGLAIALDDPFISVVNAEVNEELLQKVPHFIICDDLAAIVRNVVAEDLTQISSFIVNNEQLRASGISEAELFSRAKENTLRRWKPTVCDLGEYFDKVKPEMAGELPPSPLKIATLGRGGIDGARILAFPKLLLEEIREDMYVIPSSRHEILLVPVSLGMFPLDMLREVNREVLTPEEFLSDNIYLASKSENIVRKLTFSEVVDLSMSE